MDKRVAFFVGRFEANFLEEVSLPLFKKSSRRCLERGTQEPG